MGCGMASSNCKICKTPFPSFEALKTHWRCEHPRQYVAVQTWLADVDEAIVVAECVVEQQERGIDLGSEKLDAKRTLISKVWGLNPQWAGKDRR